MDWFVQRTTAMDRRNCRVVARTSCLRRCTTVCLACLALLACGGPLPWSQARAHAASSTPPARGTVTLEVEDRSPKFLAFYEAASKDGVTSDRRWELWQSMYGFAAVPPGSDGQAMARNLFDHAWPLSPSVLERIRTQPPIVARDAKEEAIRIADLLELDRDIQVKLLLYVRGLENNAFTFMLDDGVPHVALPVEGPPESMPTLAAHELTHAVHLPLARLPGGWERSMAQTVLTEGLAMHVVKELFPGRPDQ